MIHITDEIDPNSWLNNQPYESPITELPETFMDFYRKGKENLAPEVKAEIEASKVEVVDLEEFSDAPYVAPNRPEAIVIAGIRVN